MKAAIRGRTLAALGVLVACGAILPAVRAMQDPVPEPAQDPAPATPPEDTPEGDPADELADVYFAICDYNSDGFVTIKEAQSSLGLDRETFRPYDVDRDGQISPAEFRRKYQKTIERGGLFPPPIPKANASKDKKRTSAELLETFDKNQDKALSEKELTAVIADYAVTNLSPATLIEKLDKNRSGALEEAEIPELLKVLDPTLAASTSHPKAKSVVELFGEAKPREEKEGSTPLPSRIAGPVPVFRRLDLDLDGKISMQDLIDLQRPIQLPVRVNALMATLDVDRDGAISEAELWASMAVVHR